jgi:acetyl-CoA carboxylase carboxyltransferase component
VANDATVKAGAWWPETIPNFAGAGNRHAQPLAHCLSGGFSGINPRIRAAFSGAVRAAHFLLQLLMRRKLHVPQIAAVMGMCIAGGAYLPALTDVIIMVEGTSFMGLGGPNLVKGAVGQVVSAEALGGASLHTETSGVAHYKAKDDADALAIIKTKLRELPATASLTAPKGTAPAVCRRIYDLLPADHRLPYDRKR